MNLNEIPFDASTGAKQRCWFHAAANVLNTRPRSVQPAARRALAEIRDAEDKAHAQAAIKAFADELGAKWPKAVAKVTDRPDALLAFYDMPAEHWVHLKTTNPSRPSPGCGCVLNSPHRWLVLGGVGGGEASNLVDDKVERSKRRADLEALDNQGAFHSPMLACGGEARLQPTRGRGHGLPVLG